jgi:hypothetical protein
MVQSGFWFITCGQAGSTCADLGQNNFLNCKKIFFVNLNSSSFVCFYWGSVHDMEIADNSLM